MLWLSKCPGGAANDEDVPTRICDNAIWPLKGCVIKSLTPQFKLCCGYWLLSKLLSEKGYIYIYIYIEVRLFMNLDFLVSPGIQNRSCHE
jgi:hypothetical protein